MPDLEQLGDFLKPILSVPVGDRTYRVPAISAKNALILQESMATAAKDVSAGKDPHDIELATDDDEDAYLTRVLGPVYRDMLDNDEPWVAIQHVVALTLAWSFGNLEKAQEYYNAGGKVQPARPAPKDRQPKTATRTRTAAATTTRKRA